MSSPPSASTAAATKRSALSTSVTSSSWVKSPSSRSTRRAPTATFTPASRSALAIAAPNPDDAPVTIAVLLSRGCEGTATESIAAAARAAGSEVSAARHEGNQPVDRPEYQPDVPPNKHAQRRVYTAQMSAADEAQAPPSPVLAAREENQVLSDQWRALRRSATFVAIISAPAAFLYLWKHA